MQPGATPSVRRLLVLDGLRGVSALAVVLFHIFHGLWPAHGYLAVDLFFLLSGYVVAAAYAGRLERGASVGWFFGVRMARLYPLYVAGLAVGCIQYWSIDPGAAAGSMARALVFLPGPVAGETNAFPLNPALWSLSLEVFVNLLYAAGGWRLGSRALAAAVAVAGAVLVALSIHHGGSDFGSRSDLSNYLSGFARVMVSFPLGVLIWRVRRAGRLPAIRLSPIIAAVGLVAIYCAPIGGAAFDLAAILVAFPALFVAFLNAGQPSGVAAALCLGFGRISYALYALHTPFIRIAHVAMPLGIGAVVTLALVITLSVASIAHLSIEPWGRRAIERIMAGRRIAAPSGLAR